VRHGVSVKTSYTNSNSNSCRMTQTTAPRGLPSDVPVIIRAAPVP
jgi:hypothetical protein